MSKNEEKQEEAVTLESLQARAAGLKNSYNAYISLVSELKAQLKQAQADVIACRARMDEINKLIQKYSPQNPEKP